MKKLSSLKKPGICLLIIIYCLSGFSVNAIFALPSGMTVIEGQATSDSSDPNGLIITASDHAILDWDSFSINANEFVRFIQADTTASVLSRVTGSESSYLAGSLFSPGQFILINSNGIHFASGADIQVGSLIASTLDIQNAMYLNNELTFEKSEGSDLGSILNEAVIKTPQGYIALLAEQIQNKGVLEANLGSVVLSIGEKQTLSFDPNGLINLVVEKGLTEAETNPLLNEGTLRALGGKVLLSAKTLNDTFDTIINNTGLIEATSAMEKDGKIVFVSNAGIQSFGQIKSNIVEEKGASFRLGGIYQVDHSYHDNLDNAIVYAADVGVAGAINDIADIIINAGVTLTLTGDTTFRADSDANGTGAFTMTNTSTITGGGNSLTIRASQASTIGNINNVGIFTIQESQAASNPTFTSSPTATTWSAITDFRITSGTLNRFTGGGTGVSPYLIYDVYGLQAMSGFLASTFALNNDIAAASTSGWNTNTGFTPVGTLAAPFTGDFDGQNYTISDLFINRPAISYVGLFGSINSSAVSNLGLLNVNITGSSRVGAISGRSENSSALTNVYSSGAINAQTSFAGGLIGELAPTSISGSHSSANVTGAVNSLVIGGLTGIVRIGSTVSNSYATGNVSGGSYAGGLSGESQGVVTNSYATGNVTGLDAVTEAIGGFIGSVWFDVTSNSHSTGNVVGSGNGVGGFVGGFNSGASISNSYATGRVTANGASNYVGGFGGYGLDSSITTSFSTGSVTAGAGSTGIGGFVGDADAGTSVANSYSTGNVTAGAASLYVGGFSGWNDDGGGQTFTNTYSTGIVNGGTGSTDVGGFVGHAGTDAVMTSNYWNQTYNPTLLDAGDDGNIAGVTAKTTSEMLQQATYVGWNFATVWDAFENITFPHLQFENFMLPAVAMNPSLPTSEITRAFFNFLEKFGFDSDPNSAETGTSDILSPNFFTSPLSLSTEAGLQGLIVQSGLFLKGNIRNSAFQSKQNRDKKSTRDNSPVKLELLDHTASDVKDILNLEI